MPRISPFARYFDKIQGKSGVKKCILCLREVGHSGNTTNLKNHLTRNHGKHPDVQKLLSLKRPADSTSSGSQDSGPSKRRRSEADEDEEDVDTPSGEEIIDLTAPGTSGNANCRTQVTTPVMTLASVTTTTVTCTTTTSTCTSSVSTRTKPVMSSQVAQPRIYRAFEKIVEFKEGGSRDSEITNALLYMISVDNQPISIVENEGFKRFCKVAIPLYTVPGRKTVTNLLDQKFDLHFSRTKEKLSSVDDISITTDIWTDKLNTKSYLGVTAHYTEDAEMKSVTLATKELRTNHTAEHIQEALEEVLQEWDISILKIPGSVTDNAANIVKAARDTMGSSDKHIPCAGHDLNLVAEAVIEEFKDAVGKVKTIVTYAKHSVNVADELRDVQIASGRPVPLKLKQSVDVRWNSCFAMIDRFLELHESVNAVLIKHPKGPPMVTDQEIDQLKEMRDALAPLMKVTEALSQEKHVTASKTIPLINCVLKELEELKPETELGERMTEKIKIELRRKDRFGDLEKQDISICSTILDPRFKRLHLKDPICISDALTKINRKIRDESRVTGLEKDTENACEKERLEVSDDSLWRHHEKCRKEADKGDTATGVVGYSKELRNYLDEPIQPLKTNVIQYWLDRKTVYPNLYRVALRYLIIPATSVPSERLFSKAGLILTNRRNRIESARFSKLIFLSSISSKEWGFKDR